MNKKYKNDKDKNKKIKRHKEEEELEDVWEEENEEEEEEENTKRKRKEKKYKNILEMFNEKKKIQIKNEIYNKKYSKKDYNENIEKNYYCHKGIIKRTIGTGKVKVKVYEDDEENNLFTEKVINKNNYQIKIKNNLINKIINNYKYKYNSYDDKNYQNNIINNHNFNYNSNNYITKKSNENNKNNDNNDNNKKETIVYNIDGQKFIIKVTYYYFIDKDKEEYINITFSSSFPSSNIMHWGIYKTSAPNVWALPPKSSYPNFTKEVNNKALETKFTSTQINGERTISILLPRKLDNNDNIIGIYFVIYDPIKNIWYNNFKKNFKIQFK